MTIKALSLIMIFSLFTVQYPLLAQITNDASQAIIDAKKDANVERQHLTWGGVAVGISIFTGCLGGSIVLGASFIHEPTPPIERLIGKSPEYITYYTDTYQKAVKNDNLISALGGCVGGSLIAGIIWSKLYENEF